MSDWPVIRRVGLSGLLVTFAARMSEPANRAALALRAAIDAEGWEGVTETSTSLVSTFIGVDLAAKGPEELTRKLEKLLSAQDWYAAPLPSGRKLWRVPTVYGTDLAPQLAEAAEAAGMEAEEAVKQLSQARVRVLTIGFAPGQPYLGELGEAWDIPRQQGLTDTVPAGALIVAIRQLVLFTNASPTGWRHIGQTAFRTFRPEAETPFALSPGDEMMFPAIERDAYEDILASNADGNGGATQEVIE
ncbi:MULTISPECIES: 5-oxoprolinase subunit B family protein [unclassified Sulfitobacter]|uniref:5-oxoprolinase subunit B family protein n=1 Tax=unclassified Sulfitobacter TaxID=196795 RepID=UPI0007C2D635|nr:MULTISPECIES: carboxyltransferase domain-containing protein [unclassified Sulfitobacter]KZY03996.1 allophanate hydrolase [Sulfitobacter sp. HI0023]KZY26217.1 allophanate hydrolase [Sulfitobacter sp. HI0040]KZZ71597.1 allophanate hydrolase [Sulfitobacter sp. HI0129]